MKVICNFVPASSQDTKKNPARNSRIPMIQLHFVRETKFQVFMDMCAIVHRSFVFFV